MGNICYTRGDEENGNFNSNQNQPFLSICRRKPSRNVLIFLSLSFIFAYFTTPPFSSFNQVYPGPYIKLTEKFRDLGFVDPSLPLFRYPGGTAYPRPIPLSNENPWPNSPEIADLINKSSSQKIKVSTFKLPKEYVDSTFLWFSENAKAHWNIRNELRGEGIDKDGRPTPIKRENIFLGKQKIGEAFQALGEMQVMPRVQAEIVREPDHVLQDEIRRVWVKKSFLHLWNHYKIYAWGRDELRPLSNTYTDRFVGFGATIVDALDTLLIMDLKDEYLLARDHVKAIDFTYITPKDPTQYPKPATEKLPPLTVFGSEINRPLPPLSLLASPLTIPFFETVIRYLGSLLSAYDLSGDPLMKARAIELGDWLLPALGTKDGFCIRSYRIGENPNGRTEGKTVLSEIGSLSLEFTRLTQISGDTIYYDAVSRTTDTLDNWKGERIPGLFPLEIDSNHQDHLSGTYSFGGRGDSYYEYLIKEHQLLSGRNSQYVRMYTTAIDSAHRYLMRSITGLTGVKNMIVVGDLHWNERVNGKITSWYSTRLDHLTCFLGGTLSLGSKLLNRPKDLVAGVEFTESCMWAYDSTRTGIAPEIMTLYDKSDPNKFKTFTFPDGTKGRKIAGEPAGVKSSNNYHIQRPETIESVMYQYRITGDRRYQDQGWKMFTSWVEATITASGFAHIVDVNAQVPVKDDKGVESFVYAETFKYYYLLFSDPNLISLDDYVFTTEAHPLRIDKATSHDSAPLWKDGPELLLPSNEDGMLGKGTDSQLWARLIQASTAKGWIFKNH